LDRLGSRVLGDRAEVFAHVPYFRKAEERGLSRCDPRISRAIS
jgi:hypothetical protein